MKAKDLSPLDDALSFMKERVEVNLKKIKSNGNITKKILEEPVSFERAEKLKIYQGENKALFEENQELILLQNSITFFLVKSKTRNEVLKDYADDNPNDCIEISFEECLQQTIEGKLAFDENHPCFNNDEFIEKLLFHYEQLEQYEKCAEIVRMIK